MGKCVIKNAINAFCQSLHYPDLRHKQKKKTEDGQRIHLSENDNVYMY